MFKLKNIYMVFICVLLAAGAAWGTPEQDACVNTLNQMISEGEMVRIADLPEEDRVHDPIYVNLITRILEAFYHIQPHWTDQLNGDDGEAVKNFLISTSQLLENTLSLIEGSMQEPLSLDCNQVHQIAREIYTTYQEYGLESRPGSAITVRMDSCDAYGPRDN